MTLILRRPTDNMPTFLVIGAAKSATTSLHGYLAQHPAIYMSRVKEPDFFAFAGSPPSFAAPEGIDTTSAVTRIRLRTALYRHALTRVEDYQRLFAPAKTRPCRGECSVLYMYNAATASRIAQALPDVRIVALLRNPVDRAYSKFVQFRREGLEPIGDFASALAAEDGRIAQGCSPTWHYRQRGFYAKQLQPYCRLFSRERIHIMLYDDLQSDPALLMRQLYGFLGVDTSFAPDLSKRLNESHKPLLAPRSVWLHNLINTPNPAKSAARYLLPPPFVDAVRTLLARQNSVRTMPTVQDPMPADVRHRLQNEFRDDILRLQDVIGRDLSGWLA
jgi:hypothetical protein